MYQRQHTNLHCSNRPNNAHIYRIWIEGMLVFSQHNAKPVCMCQDAGMPHARTFQHRSNQQLGLLCITPTPSQCKNTWSCFFLLSVHQSLSFPHNVCIKNVCVFRGEKGLGDIKHGWRKVGKINKVVSSKAALQTLSALSKGQGSTVFIKSQGYRGTQTKRKSKGERREKGGLE